MKASIALPKFSKNTFSEKRACADCLADARSAIIFSSFSSAKAASIASAYSSFVVARKPFGLPPWTLPSRKKGAVMMSCRGPALLWAMVTTPAACISTTPIPKCSFLIVCKPADASDKSFCKSQNGKFRRICTWPEMPSAPARFTRLSARAWSAAFRHPPTMISFTSALAAPLFAL